MEGQFQTSFIPKRPLVQKTSGGEHRKASLFLRGTIVIFILVLLLAGGAFAYTTYLTNSNTNLKTELDAAVQNLHPDQVSDMQRLDTRIKTTQSLLAEHMALSEFFTLLGRATLSNVRFSSFHYTYSPEKIAISMDGEAQGFSAVSWQQSVLSAAPYSSFLSNPQFMNFSLNDSGNVTFTFTANLNPTAFLYANKFSPAQASTTSALLGPVTQNAGTSTVATSTVATSKTASTTKTTH